MSNVNLEENLEDLVKQIQTANDKAVFDEILMLQKFIGQPMTDHAPVHVSFSFGQNHQEIGSQNFIQKTVTKVEREICDLEKLDERLDRLISVADKELDSSETNVIIL